MAAVQDGAAKKKALDLGFVKLLETKILEAGFSLTVKTEFFHDLFCGPLTTGEKLQLVQSVLEQTPAGEFEDGNPQGFGALTQEPFAPYYQGKWELPDKLKCKIPLPQHRFRSSRAKALRQPICKRPGCPKKSHEGVIQALLAARTWKEKKTPAGGKKPAPVKPAGPPQAVKADNTGKGAQNTPDNQTGGLKLTGDNNVDPPAPDNVDPPAPDNVAPDTGKTPVKRPVKRPLKRIIRAPQTKGSNTRPTAAVKKPTPLPMPAEAPDRGVENPLALDWGDLLQPHTFKGQLQPSVAVRVRQAIHFLADEDAFRCDRWEKKVAEIKDWLTWLRTSGTVDTLAPRTVYQIEEAGRRLRAHEIFGDHHASDDRVHLFRPSDVPKPQPRLRAQGGLPVVLAEETSKADGPRMVLHRPPKVVNRLPEQYRGKAVQFREELAQHEDEEWGAAAASGQRRQLNLFRAENESYEEHMKAKKGWVVVDELGSRSLPTGLPLKLRGDDWAAERGARRAGFQQCLKHFTSSENVQVQTPFRRIVLPTPQREVELAAEKTKEIQFLPVALPPDNPKVRENLETHSFTVAFERYQRARADNFAEARRRTEVAMEGDATWLPLPKTHNAVVVRPFPADVRRQQDLFREVRLVWALLERAQKIAPRPLLKDVTDLAKEAAKDRSARKNFGVLEAAGTVVFDPDLDETKKATQEVKLISETELFWLKFLAKGSCNRGLTRDLPHENASLFLVFADRLQRLMDDVSNDENKLFKDVDEEVPLETLLEVMNRGVGHRTKGKTGFCVYDAMYWLKRLQNFGRCRFEEDILCYGYVRRPMVDIHPEHRIWDEERGPDGMLSWIGRKHNKSSADEDTRVGAPRRNAELLTLEDTIHRRKPWAGDLTPAVANFYRRLGYRLGYTLHEYVNRIQHEWWKQNVPRTQIDNTIRRWEEEYAKVEGEQNATLRLVDVVRHADPQLYETCNRRIQGGLTEETAGALVRAKVIREAERSWTPLYPATPHRVGAGEADMVFKRPPVWEWAKAAVRGKAPCFFALDRWPLYLQSEATATRVRTELRDPRILWDPCSEDITPLTWYRGKAEQIQDREVVFRAGPRSYNLGDTPFQRTHIENFAMEQVARALGMVQEDPTWFQRVTRSFRLQEPVQGSPRSVLPTLPEVDAGEAPESIACDAEIARKRAAEGETGPRKRLRRRR